MRHLMIILLLILGSCKSEKSNHTPAELWSDYIASNTEFAKDKLPDADFFHNNKKDADRLGQLVLAKKKQASSSLFALYEAYDMSLPQVGNKQIVTDFEGNALAVIETVRVDTIPFHQITEAYAALDMGTTKEPLTKWIKAHWDFFERFLTEIDQKPTEEMLVVCEYFETIWPKESNQ